jgi:hypothetical protein
MEFGPFKAFFALIPAIIAGFLGLFGMLFGL